MSEFKRLVEDPSTDDLEVDLLRFARREGPSLEARAKILAGLGAGAVGGSAALQAAPGSQAAGTSIAPAAIKSGVLLKWLAAAGALLAPLAIWFAVGQTSEGSHQKLEPTQTRPLAPAAPAHAEQAREAPLAAPAVTKLEDLPVLPSDAARAPAPSAQPSLADEVKAIQRARSALSSGNARAALAELDAYKQAFPRGRLAQEATVLRIEALSASGDRSAASKLGRQFLEQNEKSPYAARVRSVLGE